LTFSICCTSPLVSYDWANDNGQNHRARPGQAVCVGCGKGHDVSTEDYAALVAADAAYEAREREDRRKAAELRAVVR
jgi:hypothetical protein